MESTPKRQKFQEGGKRTGDYDGGEKRLNEKESGKNPTFNQVTTTTRQTHNIGGRLR